MLHIALSLRREHEPMVGGKTSGGQDVLARHAIEADQAVLGRETLEALPARSPKCSLYARRM